MALDLGADDTTADDTPDAAGPRAPAGAGSRLASEAGRLLPPERLRWLLPLVVIAFAACLRFAYLPHPERIYFDETYYATNAAQLLDYGVEAEPRVESDPAQGADPVFVVHPPVGKWLIAAGIATFGDNALGWRFSSAVAGTLFVAATYFMALRLFRRRGVAALTAFLLSIEGLALTMSRISMLDIFLALFVALGVWALLIDRDHRWALVAGIEDLPDEGPADRPDAARTVAGDGDPPFGPAEVPATAGDAAADRGVGVGLQRLPRMPRTYVWLAGVAFGLALATKASAVLAIAAAGLYLLCSELAWRRALTGRWWRQPWRLIGLGVGALLVVPAVVYVLSYASWFANYERTRPGEEACGAERCDAGPVDIARGWIGEQQAILAFHRDLTVTHDYRAPAIWWPLTRRPVVYYYESCLDSREPDAGCDVPPGTLEEIIGLGNPAIWWTALAVYPFLLYAAVRRRDRVAATIAVFLLGQYLPWLGPSRPLFFFYALPMVPFVVLALGWAATRLLPRRGVRWGPIGAASLALAAFVWWAPVYYGMQMSESAWRMRMWFNSWI
jgi:dolichyl-phosphate-mannose-protein mannosyltransferase